jgi:hypothetical protein
VTVSDYWSGEYKNNELATLRKAAARNPKHRAYVNALVDHYEAGGTEDTAPAPNDQPFQWRDAVGIANAVEGIYRAVNGTDRSGPADRSYVTRQLAADQRRETKRTSAASRRAAAKRPGPLTDLLNLEK